ncbi:hypothetical protein MPSEU_000043300 [Mayamaea pseudoterrestris]|nr:hypothetical protein MPSEU_000043300 [Mayamaea pseudoterrestris]
MAHILQAVQGSTSDLVPVKRALLSVSDKTGIVEFATFLASCNVHLLSTGGTAAALRQAGLQVTDVSEFTGAPECLDGRVKTLHPMIHGGLLAVRGNPQHDADMLAQKMQYIDMTVLNLYPFQETVAQPGNSFEQCIENIDIGGPSMMRSTAKNHQFTAIVTNPTDYAQVMECMKSNDNSTTLQLRKLLSAKAFALSASYDGAIASYFSDQLSKSSTGESKLSTPAVVNVYQPEFPLKYGCNPHQNPAGILSRVGQKLPFQVLCGSPGYINLLDALNAWQLVSELKEGTGGTLVAAASFKHVSPAGAAVSAVPLSDVERDAYGIPATETLTPAALAYVRARNADPMCSFGDFCALSDEVDEATALFLKKQVSDGIIAPGFSDRALEILKTKKAGKFIILRADPTFQPGSIEYREVFGTVFSQKRNDVILCANHFTSNIATTKKELSQDAIRDLIVASICIKYTQSNSVGFCKHGMMVGVGAGQQSRVDCVKLAGRKVITWYLRQHPKVLGLPFKDGVKNQDKVNARVRYIEGDFTVQEYALWKEQFVSVPEPLTAEEKDDFMKTSSGVAISSDAFFPFRDSIDHASKLGVSYVAQPGGSVQDGQVAEACNTYDMTMAFTGVRLFHH